jgi:hypothetical protein
MKKVAAAVAVIFGVALIGSIDDRLAVSAFAQEEPAPEPKPKPKPQPKPEPKPEKPDAE